MKLKVRKTLRVMSVYAEVDVEETAGRYHVTLSYVPERNTYIIAAPNYFKAMETTLPHRCAYKLKEKDTMSGDAEAIEEIVREILLPKLNMIRDEDMIKIAEDGGDYELTRSRTISQLKGTP